MYLTTVIYTNRKLNFLELSGMKRYQFICNRMLSIGDMIESPVYNTPMQVVDVQLVDKRPVRSDGILIKDLIVDRVNGNDVVTVNEEEEMPTKTNDMFSGIMTKYSGQFIPQKEDKVRMSLTGLLCVPQDGEYIGADNENNLVSFPAEMTLPIPVYSIVKQNSALAVGDIVKNGNNYSKVIAINPDGSLKTLSFSGFTHNKKPVKDFMLGEATTRVLINMFNFDEKSGFNPIFFAMASGETMDVNSLLMLSMTPQGKNLFSNAGGGFNPAMLWMLDKNRQGGGNDIATMMLMSSAMGGQNPFGNMLPTVKPEKKSVEDVLNEVLADPEALKKLKEALNKTYGA